MDQGDGRAAVYLPKQIANNNNEVQLLVLSDLHCFIARKSTWVWTNEVAEGKHHAEISSHFIYQVHTVRLWGTSTGYFPMLGNNSQMEAVEKEAYYSQKPTPRIHNREESITAHLGVRLPQEIGGREVKKKKNG